MSESVSATTPEQILARARQQTGLNEIDSDSWQSGLAILLDEINSSSAYTTQGRERLIGEAVDGLARRLRVHDYIQQHPEVLNTPIERPLITLGMPRTGTTVISYLLDQDPARRSLLHWECTHPVPPATTETLRTDPRCLALLEEQQQILKFVNDVNMPLPHWEDADGPTECMFIHTQDFKGLSLDSYLSTPRYAQWVINEADMTTTYEYQKRYLQILQSRAPGIWSLKMPSHAVHIDALLSVFPDARLIWAHRDPYRATGSLCNLWKLPKSIVMKPDAMDLVAMGRDAASQMQAHVDRPLRARDRIGDHRFFHMYYHEMMADPMDVMRRLYAWAGDELTSETESRMRAWLAAHPQNRFAPNAYSLDEYGLTVEELEPIFAGYLAAFDIKLEGVGS